MNFYRALPCLLLCLCLTAASSLAQEVSPAVSPPAASANQENQEYQASKIDRFFNPPQRCPHCQKEYAADRSMWMLALGFLGQIFFTSRFLLQWIASERRKESYIPPIFWHLSVIGSIMLFAYSVSIMAWPIILGQAFGIIVYARNLVLIARKRNRETAEIAARMNQTPKA